MLRKRKSENLCCTQSFPVTAHTRPLPTCVQSASPPNQGQPSRQGPLADPSKCARKVFPSASRGEGFFPDCTAWREERDTGGASTDGEGLCFCFQPPGTWAATWFPSQGQEADLLVTCIPPTAGEGGCTFFEVVGVCKRQGEYVVLMQDGFYCASFIFFLSAAPQQARVPGLTWSAQCPGELPGLGSHLLRAWEKGWWPCVSQCNSGSLPWPLREPATSELCGRATGPHATPLPTNEEWNSVCWYHWLSDIMLIEYLAQCQEHSKAQSKISLSASVFLSKTSILTKDLNLFVSQKHSSYESLSNIFRTHVNPKWPQRMGDTCL